jgi:hypothetical protein
LSTRRHPDARPRNHRGYRSRQGGDRPASGFLLLALVGAALSLPTACAAPPRASLRPLRTAVIKASAGTCGKGKTCHRDRAGVFVPKTDIGIVSVSIAEQVDVDAYVDVEVSTKPEMYQCNDVDAVGCIFRMKYAGPGLYVYGASAGNTYLGSNITDTSLSFPAGYGIVVPAGTPIYLHLDVINESLIDLKVDQDAWLYFTPLP